MMGLPSLHALDQAQAARIWLAVEPTDMRWACPKFLRQSFHEWAGHSMVKSAWARAYYQQRRNQGQDHHAAVRALAFKWIRILFRCWKDWVAYDEGKYLAALAKRGSPLSALLVVPTRATM